MLRNVDRSCPGFWDLEFYRPSRGGLRRAIAVWSSVIEMGDPFALCISKPARLGQLAVTRILFHGKMLHAAT